MSWQRRLHHQQQEQQQHHTQRPQRRRLHAAQPGRIGMPQSHPARFSPSSTAMVSRVAFLNIVIRLPILGFLLNHCAAWFFVQAVVTATPTTTTGTIPTTTATASTTGVSDSTRDVLVQAAPFCAAVVCRDGVALLATHTMDSEEPLLYFDHRDENDIGTTSVLNHQLYQDRPIPPTTTDPAMAEAFTIAQNDTTILVASHNILSGLWDLPESYAGPFRIHTIDAYGTSLLTVGWRADGDNLRQRARKLAITYQRQYGDANIPANRSYRNYLAQELALYLAECALSDSLRPLRCVAMLAFSIDSDSCTDESSPLWFIDTTGAYPVRAMCVGGGMLDGTTPPQPMAKVGQERIRQRLDRLQQVASAEMALSELIRTLQSGSAPLLGQRGSSRLELGFASNSRLIRKSLLALSAAIPAARKQDL